MDSTHGMCSYRHLEVATKRVFSEITTWNTPQIHRNNDLDMKMCANLILEQFQHQQINICYELWCCVI